MYIAGRKKELIKTGAENVYPKEVENVLEKHPDISDVTVIGLADPDGWGEKVTAVVVPRPGAELTLEALKAFCRGKIAGYKIPKEVRFVDAIPRNAIGKVVKYRLAEALRDSS